MFTSDMIETLLAGSMNPIHYYSHLSDEDKKFVMNNILEKDNTYTMEHPLSFPEIAKLSMGEMRVTSKYQLPNIVKSTIPLYRYCRNVKFKKLADMGQLDAIIPVVQGESTEVCSDYYSLIRWVPDYQIDSATLIMLDSVLNMEFKGYSTYAALLDAYGVIFETKKTYEISPVIRGLETTFEYLYGFIEINFRRAGLTSTGELNQMADYLNLIDILDGLTVDLNDMRHLSLLILSIIGFYLSSSMYEKEEVWNSYMMRTLRHRFHEDASLNEVFEVLWASYTNPAEINPDVIKYINAGYKELSEYIKKPISDYNDEKLENQLNERKKSNLDKYKPEELIPSIVGVITDNIGVQAESSDISFMVDEERLAMYMSKFNTKYPIDYAPLDDSYPYMALYKGDYYALFTVASDDHNLYGVRVSNTTEMGKSNIVILQFPANQYISYVFVYDTI